MQFTDFKEDKVLNQLITVYIELLKNMHPSWRYTTDGQRFLSEIRDCIAEASGLTSQEVQDECESESLSIKLY